MKHWILRFFASASIKKGVGFALQVSILIVDAIRGVLAGDNLPDDKRGKLAIVLTGAVAIRDFLQRLAELIGATQEPNTQSLQDLVDKAHELDRITDGL